MIHLDYQYSPKLVTAMASMVASGHYDVVLGSRIYTGGTLKQFFQKRRVWIRGPVQCNEISLAKIRGQERFYLS
jgi:hypothetical protein